MRSDRGTLHTLAHNQLRGHSLSRQSLEPSQRPARRGAVGCQNQIPPALTTGIILA